MTQREPEAAVAAPAPPTEAAPPAAATVTPAASSVRRPVLSWVAAFGTLVVAVLLVRTVVAYPLLPVRLAGPAAPTATSYTGPGSVGGSQPQVSSTTVQFGALSFSSADYGWATGFTNGDANTPPGPVLLRYAAGRWSRAPLPSLTSTSTNPSSLPLSSILAVADNEAWATAGNMVLHYVGGAWLTDLTLSDQNIFLTEIAMVSPDEGWAIGSRGDANGESPVLYHRHNGAWTAVPLPQSGQMTMLRSISMFSPDEGWICGLRYTSSGSVSIALHYAQGRWAEADGGLPAGGAAESIAAIGQDEAWAVGYAGPMGPGYIAHYLNGLWEQAPIPTPNMLHAISMPAHDIGLIGGDGAATLRLRPDGTWVKEGLVIHGVALQSVAMVSVIEGWAAGGNVLLHLHNGVWSLYQLNV